MDRLVGLLLDLLDPPSPEEKRLERKWQCRLKKIQAEMQKKQ